MDAHVHNVATLIDQSDHLLIAILLIGQWHTYESCKLTYAEIHMHNEVTWFHLLQFLHRQCHLTLTSLIRLQVVLMESVEYLMIRKETCLQVMVYESLMDCHSYWDKRST